MLVHLLVVLCCCACSDAAERHFYLSAEEGLWDYAPGGRDLVSTWRNNASSLANDYITRSRDRLGHVYKKAMFREYTDATFTLEKLKPRWLGFLGPILEVEVGDTVKIHFINRASREYSVHAHGATYNKTDEGALYNDGYHNVTTSADLVKPGDNYTYTWNITEESGPALGGEECVSWMYHSHIDTTLDINSGLVGFVYVCKPGTLRKHLKNRHVAVYVSHVDENFSWYIDDNVILFAPHANRSTRSFKTYNAMHAINGFVYGNLPGLDFCEGETATFHFATMGHATDIHQMVLSGHSFKQFKHRYNSISLGVAQFVTATVTMQTPGRWLLYDSLAANLEAGSAAFVNIRRCGGGNNDVFRPRYVRRYYIAAEDVLWNYAPSGKDRYNGGGLHRGSAALYFQHDRSSIGGTYKKAVYVEYTDKTFRVQKRRTSRDVHLGFLGPPIRAQVGDAIEVYFLNRADRTYSIHPNGVRHDKRNEGLLYQDFQQGKMVKYHWSVPPSFGPEEDDAPCLTRMYSSGTNLMKDIASGLVGPMVICKEGFLTPDGRETPQRDVDGHYFLYLSNNDENYSWYIEDNIHLARVDPRINRTDPLFVESNTMRAINGFMYSNLPNMTLCQGTRVRLHVFSMGSVQDLHALYVHGNDFVEDDQHKRATGLTSGTMKSLVLSATHEGFWALQCYNYHHFESGMTALYNVRKCTGESGRPDTQHARRERRYYIRAEEVLWDYGPLGRDAIKDQPFGIPGSKDYVYTNTNETFLGTKYIKLVFVQYTDATFKTPRPKTKEEETQGFIGPIIKVEVGETLTVVFRNQGRRPYSIHAEGLSYNRNEIRWKVKGNDQPVVAPGNTFTYHWTVAYGNGPGGADSNCVTRMYYSDVNVTADTHTGLIGPLVVCRKGILDVNGRRKDVDREFAVYFTIVDENSSWYLDMNIKKFASRPDLVNKTLRGFTTSNHMHSVNGYIYGNQPAPVMYKGEEVSWYLMTMGSEFDLHSLHFHGNLVTEFSDTNRKNDVVQLFPGMFVNVRMRAMNTGKWLYHCHVNNHLVAGMESRYHVLETLN
ncbi:hephaestin-like protein [Haliotis rubra]|uniref:hephaestin-like protein n=1 Tax=Haliotis rubra TaxID=36100 RepID=UPI001EE5E97C|nr:hephaestin-like protein [Haliotis rubra]